MSFSIDTALTDVQLQHYNIQTPDIGELNFYTQGSLEDSEVCVLTCHDLGCNHTNWIPFTLHESMQEFTSRVFYIHVCVPGQEDDASDLPKSYKFPTMQELGANLIHVLDHLKITRCVVIGEGAGANIVARMALADPSRVDGAILIHCTGTTAGVMESFKDKIINWKLQVIGMNPTAESYLVLHRFGDISQVESENELRGIIHEFQSRLRQKINPKNLKMFIETFLNRSNLVQQISSLEIPALFVTGDLASFNHTVHTMHSAALSASTNRKRIELVEINDVANVIHEAPGRLSEAILFFVQGIGRLASVPMASLPKGGIRYRTMSMEAADRPKLGGSSD